MTTSRTTSFLSEIADKDAIIPVGKRAYFGERARQEFYDYVLSKFTEKQKTQGLTKAKLARRIGIGPDRMSKLLGAPGNWTLETVSDLLLGISGEELIPYSTSLQGRKPRNYRGAHNLIVETGAPESFRNGGPASKTGTAGAAAQIEVK